MPVHNAGPYLRGAVDSILTQTFGDFELIAIDDGSTDGSADLLDEMASEDPRLRVLRQANAGVSATLRRGVDLARGRLLARMDGDDLALPDRLAAQVRFLDEHPDHVLVGGMVDYIDPDGDPIGRYPFYEKHETIEAALLRGETGLVHPAVTMRLDAVRDAGGYGDQPAAQDYDLFLRLAERGKLHNLRDRVLLYRLHPGAVGTRKGDVQKRVKEASLRAAMTRRGLPYTPPPDAPPRPTGDDETLLDWARRAIAEGHYRTARKHAYTLIKRRPTSWHVWRLAARATAGRHGRAWW